MSAGKQAAQTCLRLDEMPNVLLPSIRSAGTINPIIIPATYHGQGCWICSIILVGFKIKGKILQLLLM